MEKVREKLKERQNKSMSGRTGMRLIIALVALIVCLGVSVGMQLNIHHRYSKAANLMQEQTFQHLTQMIELFSRVEDPEVDVQNKLIPALNAQYTAVAALNAALTEGFGASKAVLQPEQISAFDTAFAEYSDAYRLGLETGLAKADMTACLEEVQQMLVKRSEPTEKPTEPPVIIDGSSGEIATIE